MLKRAILVGALVGLLSACAAPTGPLALVASTGDQAVTQGQIRVSGDCVHLVTRGEEVLLVWPADRAAWNAAEASITVTATDGSEVAMFDGMQVALAGGGWSAAESEADTQDQVAAVSWVVQPEEHCLRDQWWFVSGVAE